MRSHYTTTREKPPPQSLQLEKSQRGSEALFDTTQPNNKIIKKRKRNGSWGGGQGWPWRHATFCGLPRAGSVTWVVHGKSLLMPSFSSILQHNVRTHFSPWWYIYLAIRWLWGIHKRKIKLGGVRQTEHCLDYCGDLQELLSLSSSSVLFSVCNHIK